MSFVRDALIFSSAALKGIVDPVARDGLGRIAVVDICKLTHYQRYCAGGWSHTCSTAIYRFSGPLAADHFLSNVQPANENIMARCAEKHHGHFANNNTPLQPVHRLLKLLPTRFSLLMEVPVIAPPTVLRGPALKSEITTPVLCSNKKQYQC